MIRNLTGLDTFSIQNVFLDLDGTIMQSGEGITSSVKYMFKMLGRPELDKKRINAFVGPTVKVHLQEAYGFSADEAAEAYKHYRAYYVREGCYQNKPYDGIKKAICKMKESGKTVYVATLKPEDQAEQILGHFGLRNLFTNVFGARHDLGIMHKEGVLDRAARILGAVPPGSVMVGDRCHDVLAGKHVGIGTIGALYGYGTLGELTDAGCDIVIDTVEDLSAILGGSNE